MRMTPNKCIHEEYICSKPAEVHDQGYMPKEWQQFTICKMKNKSKWNELELYDCEKEKEVIGNLFSLIVWTNMDTLVRSKNMIRLEF